jgi:hypothetical protein
MMLKNNKCNLKLSCGLETNSTQNNNLFFVIIILSLSLLLVVLVVVIVVVVVVIVVVAVVECSLHITIKCPWARVEPWAWGLLSSSLLKDETKPTSKWCDCLHNLIYMNNTT